MNSVEFWFEFASTYSYPAAMRIEQMALARGIDVRWHAFLLGPIFREQGWTDSPFNLYPAKGRYMWRDLERICAQQDVPLRRPSQFPRSSLLAARVACCFASESWLPEFVRRVYHANFAEDRDIADAVVIGSVLDSLGQDSSDILMQAQSAAAKDKLRSQTEQARMHGIFGAPTLRVGEELFWGNDRIEAALDWCTSTRRDLWRPQA